MATSTLRREDLPTDVLYGRDKMWVVFTGPDTARVGYAAPVLGPAPLRIYFLDLQPRGYLVGGKPCGGMDLEHGRIPFIAPLSGRITRVNTELEAQPERLLEDPFGAGWLYEIEKIPEGSRHSLLDRDRLWSLLLFERSARSAGVRPVIEARSRWSPRAPWPEHTTLSYGGRLAVQARLRPRGRNARFTPQWQPGDRWEVAYTFVQPSLARVPPELAVDERIETRWRYEVVRLDAMIDGRACYEVRAEEIADPPLPSFQILYIDLDDFSLRLVEERNRFLPDRRSLDRNDGGRCAPYLELRQPRQTIVDLGLFPAEDREAYQAVRTPGEPELEQWVTFPNADTLVVRMEAQYLGRTFHSEQTWRRGDPWWSEARRLVGDREVIRGRLVRA